MDSGREGGREGGKLDLLSKDYILTGVEGQGKVGWKIRLADGLASFTWIRKIGTALSTIGR